MAMEPASDNSGTTMLALIVGALAVLVIALFAFGGFGRAPISDTNKTSISVETPKAPETPAPTTP